MPVPQDQGDGQTARNILLALLADLELETEHRVEAAPRTRGTNQAEEGGGSMRRMWRRLVQKWREFREAGHKALVLHRHLEGRCTWFESRPLASVRGGGVRAGTKWRETHRAAGPWDALLG
jgi:hypothetical protein